MLPLEISGQSDFGPPTETSNKERAERFRSLSSEFGQELPDIAYQAVGMDGVAPLKVAQA